jgi:uncharacterized integral membrane protein
MKTIKTYLALALLGLFIVFAVQNANIVNIKFILWQVSISRVVLLLITLVLGFAIGFLFSKKS